MAYAYPLKTKSATEMVDAFETFIFDIDDKISVLETDAGNEFTNAKVEQLLKDHDITHHVAEAKDKTSQGKIERFNRTIREKIERYFTAYDTYNWVKPLPEILYNYNHTVHRIIGKAPADVDEKDADEIREKEMIRSGDVFHNFISKIQVGDSVRVLKQLNIFDKRTEAQYSPEVYIVHSQNGPSFKVMSPAGNVLKNSYRVWQIQKVDKEVEKRPVEEEQKYDPDEPDEPLPERKVLKQQKNQRNLLNRELKLSAKFQPVEGKRERKAKVRDD